MKKYILKGLLLAVTLLNAEGAMASCGVTDYTGGSGRLYDMALFVLVLCYYSMTVVEALAGVLAIYSATQIYIKMNTGEDGITKSIVTLVGAVLFLLGAIIVLPAFFGVEYGSGGGKQFNFLK